SFLKGVLEAACKDVASNTGIDEAVREVALDSDTEGVAGQPPIVDTILKKIDDAAVFVADMTFTGSRLDGRLTPNPNVLIEYGWALKTLTHARVISVMNDAYGEPSRDTLPFDLSHVRWPIRYTLSDVDSSEQRTKEKTRLVAIISAALKASLATIPSHHDASFGFPFVEAKDGPARFRANGEPVGVDNDFGTAKGDVFLSGGPSIWLRLMPIIDKGSRWPTYKLQESAIKDGKMHLAPFSQGSGCNFLRAEDGFGIYCPTPRQNTQDGPVITGSIAFAFETGEVWSIDTLLLSYKEDWIPPENYFTTAITRYARFLRELGIEGPYRWIAGMEGVKGRRLYIPPPPNHISFGAEPICVADIIQEEGTYDGGDNPISALRPFFEKIYAKCGHPRPAHLHQ
ncbi:MAG: hypothetical protein Q7S76_03130, partial [bacterium]|nr:hypothetical protein [bacterium]